MSKLLDDLAIENFREYLRIPTVHPTPNYADCETFLRKQAEGLDLPVKVITIASGKPIVVITWKGTDPNLPSILLNSHSDVVPVFEDKWTHKPFDAYMDEKGDIYARGAQDVKCLGILYLEAIRRMKNNGVRLRRTIHVSFVPDEEIGGVDGMGKFVKSPEFKQLNVGFALDEGVPGPTGQFIMFYGEKTIWQIHVHCTGPTGHASILFPNTAGQKINYMINKFMELRQINWEKYPEGELYFCDEATSINLTKLYGGIQENVVPEKLTAVFDIRIGIGQNLTEFEELINRWCDEAGGGITIEYKQKDMFVSITELTDDNQFWVAFKTATEQINLELRTVICPGTTDARYLRQVGVPSLGFTPMDNTLPRVHDHNEYANKDIFLKGIDILCKVIPAVANA